MEWAETNYEIRSFELSADDMIIGGGEDGLNMTEQELPSESQMNRVDALDAFLEVINVVQPKPPFLEVQYPLKRSDVDFGTTRNYHARCGAKKLDDDCPIVYKTRMTHIHNISREEHISLLTHEVTHVNIEVNEFGSTHPPAFWIEMARHARIVRESLQSGRLSKVFPDAKVDNYEDEVINNPNNSTVDLRYWSVEECKNQISKFINDDSYDLSQSDYWIMRPRSKKVNYKRPDRDSPREIKLVDLPGIGKRVVENIGPEFETVDEMINGLELDTDIKEAVPPQFHDDLWAELRRYVEVEKAPSTGEDEYIRMPERELFLTEDGRNLPSDEVLIEYMIQEIPDDPSIGLFDDDTD